MRPVNLIPPEDRRGEHAPLRTGAAAYVLLGVLAIALVTVTALVLTTNGIKDREAELAELEARKATATQTVQTLNPYVQFASLSAARDQTITSLAKSRFDWERVLRELSLVIPENVWLIGATGTIAPGTSTGGSGAGEANSLRQGATGPALELVGCASSQPAVAGFVAALEDIDGVTRVGLSSSERGADAGASGSSGASSDCRTRSFIARFEILVAFDEAPAPGAAPLPTDPAAPASPVAQQDAAAASAAEQTGQANDAANLAGGG